MKDIFKLTGILLASLITFTSSNAQNTSASWAFSLQGRLTNLDGSTIANGSHIIRASVYQSGTSNALYTETDIVTTLDGAFDITLGACDSNSKLILSANGSYDLGIAVDGGAELTPRLAINSVLTSDSAKAADTAATAWTFPLQGRLANPDGSVIANGLHTIKASVYQSGTSNAIYTETDTVTTFDGAFDIVLGSGNGKSKLILSATGSYELGIAVDGAAELTPRLAISSVSIADSAIMADTPAVAMSVIQK